MRLVVFDPFQSAQATSAEEWVPIKVGTDSAVALSMANLLLNEYKMFDAQYLKWKTNAPYLVGPKGYYMRDAATKKPLIWDLADSKAKTYDTGFALLICRKFSCPAGNSSSE